MMRSLHGSGFFTGLALGSTLALGCSGGTPSAESPTPPFESRITEGETRVRMTPPPADDATLTDPAPDTPDTAGSPAADEDDPRPSPVVAREVALCSALAQQAMLKVEEIQGGASIVLTPRTAADAEAVRDAARAFEQRMRGPEPRDADSACALFDLGRAGARAAVSEGPSTMRILITTADPAQVDEIRRAAKNFAIGAAREPAPAEPAPDFGEPEAPPAPPIDAPEGP